MLPLVLFTCTVECAPPLSDLDHATVNTPAMPIGRGWIVRRALWACAKCNGLQKNHFRSCVGYTVYVNQCHLGTSPARLQLQRSAREIRAMSETGESPPPTAPEEQPQPSEEAESAPSGASRQHNSDSWVIVDNPESKPAETYVSCSIARSSGRWFVSFSIQE